jgi:hypothetical protein
MPNFPTSLDSLTNPSSSTYLDDSGFELDVLIGRLQDIAEALEAKVGIGASTASANSVLRATGTGSSGWGPILTTDITANAITQSALSTASSASTTSTSYADTGASAALTTVGGEVLAIGVMCGYATAAANQFYIALQLDAATEVADVFTVPANTSQFVQVVCHRFTGVSAAAHTINLRWKVSGSTYNRQNGYVLAWEFKK